MGVFTKIEIRAEKESYNLKAYAGKTRQVLKTWRV